MLSAVTSPMTGKPSWRKRELNHRKFRILTNNYQEKRK